MQKEIGNGKEQQTARREEKEHDDLRRKGAQELLLCQAIDAPDKGSGNDQQDTGRVVR